MQRRDFLARTGRLAAGAALAGTASKVLAACGSGDAADTSPGTTRRGDGSIDSAPLGGRMNVLLFTADDMNADTPGAFGGPHDVSPTIDRLASEGMVLRRAHVAVAVCQPSRSAMLTGRYPHRNGAEGFEDIRADVPVLNDVLRPAGYRTGILGKVTHLAPVARFQWDMAHDRQELGDGRDPRRYADFAAGFFAAAADAGQPWFLMCNSHDPHRPFSGSADEAAEYGAGLAQIPHPSKRFQPGEWPTPGFLPDLPDVREEVAQYLSSSRRADDTLSAVLAEVDRAGVADTTLVIFLSDNGMSFPFAKANCYLHSTRTPLIVRWPGLTSAGSSDEDQYVSGVDLLPTICEAAGVVPPAGLDGRSFVSVLGGKREGGRDRIHTVFHEAALGDRYDMRCVQHRAGGLIWNAWSNGVTTYRADNLLGLTWAAMTKEAASDAAVAARVNLYKRRVPEELYDFESDPDGLHNLIDSPEHRALRDELRSDLLDWMKSIGDPLTDTYASHIASH